MLFTITLLDIQIAAALRTQSLAIFAAQGPHRRGQQHLFPQSIFQQQTFALIISDLGLRLADCDLVGAAIHAQRTVNQVETLIYIIDNRLKAARATEFQMRFDLAHQSDIFDVLMVAAMFHDQLSPSVAVQQTNLAKVRPKLDGPRLIVFVKLQLTEFQLPNPNQHSSTRLSPHTKPPAMHSG